MTGVRTGNAEAQGKLCAFFGKVPLVPQKNGFFPRKYPFLFVLFYDICRKRQASSGNSGAAFALKRRRVHGETPRQLAGL